MTEKYLNNFYKIFPTKEDCIKELEDIVWGKMPICPYCKSISSTYVSKQKRHHCNGCNTLYSVTVQTPFHKSKVDIRKWFMAILLISNEDNRPISARELAKKLFVTKDTSWLIINKLSNAKVNHKELMQKITKKVHELNN